MRELFDPPVDGVRLEIGFGGGEHLAAESQAHSMMSASSGSSLTSTAWPKSWTQIEAHNIANIRLMAGDAAELLAWAPQRSLSQDRSHSSRSVAEAAALETTLRAGRDHRRDGARAEGRQASFASSRISTNTAPGPCHICCGQRNSPGPRNAPTTGGLALGQTTP